MIRHDHTGLNYYTFASLDAFGMLRHAVTGRHGGVSTGPYASLNITKGSGDDPALAEENLQRVCRALQVRRNYVVSPNQCHTANVCRVDQGYRGQVVAGYDILITDQPAVPLLLRYADCVPVLIYDPAHHALALVHSGWRGTVQGATRAAVAALGASYGSRPGEMVAAIGPSIGPCCYEVGEDVISAVQSAFSRPDELLHAHGRRPPFERLHFDLWAANARWLAEAGVHRVEIAETCTACHMDEFFSYRGGRGKTGHFGALMELVDPDA
jgi:polyphenol oxidase